MPSAILLSPELLLKNTQYLLNRAIDRRFHIRRPVLGDDSRASGQMDLNRAAGVNTALIAVHVLKVDLDTAQPVAKPRPDRSFDISADRLGELSAILNVVIGAYLEDHVLPPVKLILNQYHR